MAKPIQYCKVKKKNFFKVKKKKKKDRDITLPTNVRLVKAMAFPVFMYGCESWTIRLSAEELMLLNCSAGEDS